jgi:type II secretory pathway pseudopilin PulG
MRRKKNIFKTGTKQKGMNIRDSKKAAIEMSLNLIIMLIIGLVVLGLVIGFVTQLVGQAQADFSQNLNNQEQRQQDAAMEKGGVFAVEPTTFQATTGEDTKIFLKIFNPTNTALEVGNMEGSNDITDDSQVEEAEQQGGGDTYLTVDVSSIDLNDNCDIRVFSAPTTIEGGQTKIITMAIEPRGGCVPGNSFFVNIEFTPEGTSGSDPPSYSTTLNGEVTS